MMTPYDSTDFSVLDEFATDEVVTHSFVRDVNLSAGRTLALITLDNGRDHRRPNTLGPASLFELGRTFDALAERVRNSEIDAVAITGKPYILAAGADLSEVSKLRDKTLALRIAQLGHHVLSKQSALGVPSFAFINGLALGGGLEVALHADYRTVHSGAAGIGLPEVFLGLIPGWGGAYLLPNLIGIENALRVIVDNPLRNNRTLKAADALELGIADALFPSARFLEESVLWADEVLAGERTVRRPNKPGAIERSVKWPAACSLARKKVADKIGPVKESPYRAIDLVEKARSGSRWEAFEREDEALADLVTGDQFHASMYAFNLVQKRAKHPAQAPDAELARPVTKVGVIGAGLMASQFALLFVRRLRVPVVITDLDQERVDKGLSYIHAEIDKLAERGRVSPDEASRIHHLVRGTTSYEAFADADWIIEAVFEDRAVKQQVFAAVEKAARPDAVLATNTSSLSVSELSSGLSHPERLIGFHFFNPVALMPLIEVVKTAQATDAVIATALSVAQSLRKNAVITTDTPGFVVNRVLARLLGEVMRAVDGGTPLDTVDEAVAGFGLPMSAFELLDLVGLTVAAHVLDTHHNAFPDRFYRSTNLHALAEHGELFDRDSKGVIKRFNKTALKILAGGTSPSTAAQIRTRIEDGLADEIHRMIASKVVSSVEDIDLSLILGAGWPFHMGGATPYLDRVGASERTNGDTFHHPPIRGIH